MIKNIELLNYIKENISLVRTMVIKIEDLALLDNNKMLTSLGLNSGDDKTKWRYYLNLNGEYHITDEMMHVKSLDNDEEIEFTKENLNDHLATKKAYRLGSYYYTRLAEKYSHQVDLIKGIINPIPTSESIPAKNGTILRYNTDYVNDNEILLISKVQDVINKFIYQTFSTEYKYTENLMMSFLVGRLHNVVLKEILAYRLENAFTRQAHPFYIWSHLQSCGISPIYKKVLNKEQTFWLFRNIEYILRNQGKDFTFKLLIENLLTKRDIPLLKYDLVHSTETMKEDLFPKPLYQVRRLNLVGSKGYMDELTTLPIAMTKEVPDAIDNEDTYEMYLSKTENDGRDSYTSNYPIKLLESSMVDTTLRKPETIFHVINAELIYLAKNDIYNINLDIVEPLSGNHFRFNVKEAITLWYGLLDKLNGCTSGKLGEIFYNKALKITPPTLKELMDLSGPPFLTEAWCEDLLKTHIPQSRIISPIAFFNNAKAISDLKWTHEKMYSMFPSIGYYSRRKNACSTMYESGWVKLTDFKTLDELLDKKGISLKDYNDSDLENLIFELWNKMTGWSAAGYATLGSIQQGLISLMKYLSSYSVQYIQNISVADGWYEGGLDLLTENPVNLGTDGEKPELDAGGDNFRVPVDIRVVTQNEVDKSIIGIIEENGFVLEGESIGKGSIKQTPLLYPIEIEDGEPTGGILSMNGCLDQRCIPFTGKLPFDIEDFIPKGSTLNNQHKTNSMLIDKLTGVRKIGDWEVFGLNIVDNSLDNLFVSKRYDFQYINDFIFLTGDSNTNTTSYYFSPARCEAGKYVLKLEVIVKNEKTNEVVNVRFDYPIEITESTHSVTFDIPESVNIDEEFIITPKFTGLEIGDGYEFIDVIDDPSNAYLYLEPSLNDYLTIRQENGVIYGKFIKSGWSKELPLYLQSKLKYKTSSVTDPYKEIYLHSIGNIPSDRYYDPIDDEEFIPTYQGYNQRRENTFGLIGDELKVIASKKGWSPVKLEIKKDENGNYPKRVLLDYNGFKDATKPIYEKADNEVIDGKEYSKFLTYFSYDELDDKEGQEQTLTMVLTLQNKNGLTVEKEFDYKFFMVSIMSFNIDEETLPKELPTGIDTNSEIKYRTYTSNDKHVFNGIVGKDNYNDLTMNFTPVLKDGVLGNLTINPKTLWDKDHEYLISVKGRNENYHGLAFDYISLDIINLTKDMVFDVNDISLEDIIVPWIMEDWHPMVSIYDKFLYREDIKGWNVSDVSWKDPNYDTGFITSFKHPNLDKQWDVSKTVTILNKDNIIIETPENLKNGFAVMGIPEKVGNLSVELMVTLKSKYQEVPDKKIPFNHIKDVTEVSPVLIRKPDIIYRKGQTGRDLTIEISNLKECIDLERYELTNNLNTGWSGSVIDIGTDEYGTDHLFSYNTAANENGNEFSFIPTRSTSDSEFIISNKNPGIYLVVMIRYKGKETTGTSSEGIVYLTDFIKPDQIENYPPSIFEDFELEWLNIPAEMDMVNPERFYLNKSDRNGWEARTVGFLDKDKIDTAGNILTKLPSYPQFSSKDLYDVSEIYSRSAPINGKNKYHILVNYTPSKSGEQNFNMFLEVYHPTYDQSYKHYFVYNNEIKDRSEFSLTLVDENKEIKINTRTGIKIIPTGGSDQYQYPTIENVSLNKDSIKYSTLVYNIDRINQINGYLTVKELPNEDINIGALFRYRRESAVGGIADNAGYIKYIRDITIDKKYIIDPNQIDINNFNIKPDIVYNESQPYESQTDRYLINKKFGDWKLDGILFDPSNKENGLIFYGYESEDPIYVVLPSAYFKDVPDNSDVSYLYLDLVPLKTGNVTYKLNINIINEVTKESKTIVFNYKKNVLEQSSFMWLTHNEIPSDTDEVIKIYFDNVPNKTYTSLSLGGCLVESLKGFKDTDKLNYSLYAKTVTLNLASNDDKEYVFYARWNYHWNNDSLGRSNDSNLRNITYYQQFTIPKGNVNSSVSKSLVEQFILDSKGKDIHYLNECTTYTNTGNRVLNLPVRDDFPYSNQWYVQSASLDLPEGNNLFDEEYVTPYLIKKDVSDKVQYNISFSPKEAYGDNSVQIKLRLLDNYSNSKYIYIDYNFSAEDRGTLASSNISELITGDKTDMNLEYVNIPPLRGTGFVTYPSFNPPSKWNDLVKGELDKDTNKGYITALKDFEEEIYLIYKNDYRESGKQPHLYFSRIYLKKSKAKE